jgi:hypothetical protein
LHCIDPKKRLVITIRWIGGRHSSSHTTLDDKDRAYFAKECAVVLAVLLTYWTLQQEKYFSLARMSSTNWCSIFSPILNQE